MSSSGWPRVDEILAGMRLAVDAEEELLVCAFPGDPQNVEPFAWRPIAVRAAIPSELTEAAAAGWNGYACVSVFDRDARGRPRRRNELWRGMAVLMIDDVGEKCSIDDLPEPPTWLIQTSRHSYQALYLLNRAARDRARCERLLRAVVKGLFKGKDPGMLSLTRVFRLPGFRNGKAGRENWPVNLVVGGEGPSRARYGLERLEGAFGAGRVVERRERPEEVPPAERRRRLEEFRRVVDALNVKGPMRSDGWMDVTCPWVEEHTGRRDDGAAIAAPSAENGWRGGFVCHHGSHAKGSDGEKGWADVVEYAEEEAIHTIQRNTRGWREWVAKINAKNKVAKI